MPADQVLIIGAGPFGLSVSAHLRDLNVAHQVVGRPMGTWKKHMPRGMQLRSEPYGSDLASPRPGYDVAAYCALHGLDFVERLGPLSGARFLDYADWYTAQLVPDVVDATVSEVSQAPGGLRVSFADTDAKVFAAVVVATGVLPYAKLPTELSGWPSDLVSHTSDHNDLRGFRGRRVAVVGGGQSALETSALLHEAGADVQLVVRRPQLNWLEPNPERISRLGRIRRPVNKLCEGWHCAVWNSPSAFRRLPRQMRATKARTVLGPAGAWWLKDRVDGVVDALLGHQLRGVEPAGTGVRLLLEGATRDSLEVDHIIAGTGFRVDIDRLALLSGPLRASLATVAGYPVLNRAGESTVGGLYFAGAPAAFSLGPSVRFIAGTHNTARQTASSIRRRAGAGQRRDQVAAATAGRGSRAVTGGS